MERDIRADALFQEARNLLQAAGRPGEDFVSDIADLRRSPDPGRLLFTGTVADDLTGPATTRICDYELATGSIRMLTEGPNSDRHARLSPDGNLIAFLSDRDRASDFQLFFLDTRTQRLTAGPRPHGWIEYFEWSPDGRRILLGVAAHGADLSSGQGATGTDTFPSNEPSWMPQVIGPSPDNAWRRIWIVDVETSEARCVSGDALAVWEASWCGDDSLTAIASPEPDEGAWYAAALSLIDVTTGMATPVYTPTHQLAVPRGSPSGRFVAFVEAVASDRGYVAGDLRLYDRRDRSLTSLETSGMDVTSIAWTGEDELLAAGYRGLCTVVATVRVGGGPGRTLWEESGISTSGSHPVVLGLDRPDTFVFVREGFFDRPGIATVVDGIAKIAPTADPAPPWGDIGQAEAVRWQAPDGLTIEGWLLRPGGEPPYPTVMDVHGGPIVHWRPYWLGRAPHVLMLLRHGYAIFMPNPRGSSGRGQDFAGRVVGDIGGADTADFLSGIDHLITAGIADPCRLGVMGLSYGGLMTCWLTTQDRRFGAALSVGPATNHVSHHLTCNIPQFVRLFVQDHYTDLTGRYYSRSPLLHAHHSRTPTLLVAGDLDRCTPASEALQFHNALVENGVESWVVRYPEEGHGVHGAYASADFAARCVMWFERHIPTRR